MNLAEIRELTGLPFKQHGNRFYGAFYLDGTPHERHDKTNARIKNGELWISEEGGDCLHVKQWMKLYGDSSKKVPSIKIPEAPKIERKFVPRSSFEKTLPSVYSGNLYWFLAGKFGVKTVHDTFRKYSVGEDDRGNSVFWYRDGLGNWLHDAVVPYLPGGKRNKSLNVSGWRKFKRVDGYTGLGVFGGHLIKADSEVCVVESEKTALIMSMLEKRGRVWVGTGGSNKISAIKDGWKLYPDFDMAGNFWECIGCGNRGKSGCGIRTVEENGRKVRVKNWECEHQSGAVVHWFDGLSVDNGWDVADWAMENLIRK